MKNITELKQQLQNEKKFNYLFFWGHRQKTENVVESSPYDRVWGIGLVAQDERACNPLKWDGENKLGFALMVVREELKCGLVT